MLLPHQPFRKRWALVIALLVVALALWGLCQGKSPPPLLAVRKGVLEVFSLVGGGVTKGTRKVVRRVKDIASWRQLSVEGERLRKELATHKVQILRLEELRQENQRLRELLKFQRGKASAWKLTPGEVIGRSPENWTSTVLIDVGSKRGITKDMAVLNCEGVVGRTLEVTRNTSKVLLLTDINSAIPAVNQRSRDAGIVVGQGEELLLMKYVLPGADIRKGDVIVSSKMSKVFPPGFPVGRVLQAGKKEHSMFQEVTLSPTVHFSRLEELWVVESNHLQKR